MNEGKFDIRELIGRELMIPEGALEVRGYILHKFTQFENLVNRFILEAFKENTKAEIYNMSWKEKQKKFFQALISVGIEKNSIHYQEFEKKLPSIVDLRHAMAHWVWSVAKSNGDTISIRFAKPDKAPIVVDNNIILEYQENCKRLEARLTIIYVQIFPGF